MSPATTDQAPASRRKLLLLDGHSLAYRAFFALPTSLETKSGQITNAAYGFTSMLVKLLGDEKPDGVAVCFDLPQKTFRDAKYPEYKAGRSETPDIFRQQLPLIRMVLDVMKIPILTKEGFEADDLLATLVRRSREAGDDVIVVSGDRDVLQLVGDGVSVMMTRRGISDIVRYDADAVRERYHGVSPEQWTDFAALKGETSDNLPGVPGVGDKTAAQFLVKYGDLEGVIAHADELRPKIRDALLERVEQIRLNKELGRLVDDVELEVGPSQIRLEPWDDEEVRKLFTTLEFPTIYQRLRELDLVSAGGPSLDDVSFRDLRDGESVTSSGPVALAWDVHWLAVATGDDEVLTVAAQDAPRRLGDVLADPDVPKVAHDAKPMIRAALESGIEVAGLADDTLLAAYLLEPGSAGGYPLADVARRYAGLAVDPDEPTTARGRAKQATLDIDTDTRAKVARAAAAIRRVEPVLRSHLENRGMWDLAQEMEYPLIGVLARMERAGVLIDLPYLEELGSDLGDKMAALEKRIHDHAGEPFNVNSNLQLQKVLFETLDLPKTKKIKTGYSTDQAELAKLAGVHPLVDDVIEYREVAKLKTGFTDSLIPLVNPKTGRIHTTFLQASASTGRLASTNPNIQNIPIRGDLGRQIRRAFIAPDGMRLLSADYSQIELRVLAHLTGAPGLLDAFASQHDFHAAIAAKVYGVDVADVQPGMRAYAKQFSYGIAYGMSAYGVSQRLGVELEEAKTFVDAYYAQFPQVQSFLEEQVKQATKDGFTTTMFGRRRYLPELLSPNRRVRGMGERMALNAPIQGSAADIIKKAMIDVDAALEGRPELGTMLLSVHDELVFEVPDAAAQEAVEVVKTAMESVTELRCGLVVDVHLGRTWDEAHA